MKAFFSSVATIAIVLASSLSVFAPSSANAATAPASKIEKVAAMVPSGLVVEQTARLSDGRTVTVYYKKAGNYCEVYTDCDLKGYTANDLLKLENTSFSVVRQPKGKLVYKVSASRAGKIIKRIVNSYL